jgi:hypothetical protein
MTKKINSEIKYPNTNFKIKIGTTDKKSPETVYVELGTYITPKLDKENYKEDINSFEKVTKTFFKKKIKNSDLCDNENFISIIDIANERILFNKKSYLEIQLFLKNKPEFKREKVFKTISKEIHDNYVTDSVSFIESELLKLGFVCSKRKK